MSSFLMRRATVASAGAARAFSTTSPRSVARITIIGHLADSPEGMTAGSGESLKEYVRYTVASNSGPKDARQTSWFRVTGFVDGPRRDFIMGLPKGSMVYVEGDASINTYTDSNGQNRQGLSIIQRNIEVLKRPSLPEQGE
ncbi:ssDNA binding protein [Trichoderma guizhouense]|uniref:SsDNA binding protein n=1 Tax=Trichoderma guizhouense TaxID=1491466 RepID=A0A1T3CE37_9HYPO|nr:ssDNA binding protein [Trichoderma guizhouense]